MRQSSKWALCALFTLSVLGLAGCEDTAKPWNGSGTTPTPAPTASSNLLQITGRALKGPFAVGSTVSLRALNGSQTVSTQIQQAGAYSVQIPWRGPTELTVSGRYLDEATQTLSAQPISLRAVFDASADTQVHVNVLTELLARRVEALIAQQWSAAAAQAQAQAEIDGLFDLAGVSPAQLSFLDPSAAHEEAAEALALLSYALGLLPDEAEKSKNNAARIERFYTQLLEHLAFLLIEPELATDPALYKQALANDPLAELAALIDAQDCVQAFEALAELLPEHDLAKPCVQSQSMAFRPRWARQRYQFAPLLPLVVEGEGEHTVTLQGVLSPANPKATVEVEFETLSASARAGEDFIAKRGVFRFPPGATQASAELTILGDTRAELDESLSLVFRAAGPVRLIPARKDLILLNDDGAPRRGRDEPSFDIDQFELLAARTPTGPIALDALLAGPLPDYVELDFAIAFGMDCQTSRRGAQPCLNPRPVFGLEFLAGNGGTPLVLATLLIASDQVNYRGVSGFDGNSLQRRVRINHEQLSLLREQVGDTRLKLDARAHVNNGLGAFQLASVLGPGVSRYSTLAFGNVVTEIYTLTVGNACTGGDLLVSGVARLGDRDFSYTDLCVSQQPSQGVLQVQSGSVNVDSGGRFSQGDLHGRFADIVLRATGAQSDSVIVELPPGVLAHPGPHWRARGQQEIRLDGASVLPDLSGVSGGQGGPLWLSVETLPLVMRLDRIVLGSDGLSGTAQALRYLPQLRHFADSDRRNVNLARDDFAMSLPRRRHYLHSNDIQWSRPQQRTLPISINGAGLHAQEELRFSAGSGGSHFPRASRYWGDFSARLDKSRLSPIADAAFADQSLTLYPRSDCGTCTAGQSGEDSVGLRIDQVGSLSNGSWVATGEFRGNAGWGQRAEPRGERIFEREDEGRAASYVQPGFLLEGSAQQPSLAVVLLGHRQLIQAGNELLAGTLHPLGSTAARMGNYFPPGINLGVDQLRGPDLLPFSALNTTLAGSITQAQLGGIADPSLIELRSNQGTKYVIRGSGVTGVFQGEAPSLSTEIYGYPINFSRFAFRVVENQLDPYTWIDGEIGVPGDAGLDLVFESLALNCDGSIDGGLLAPGLCQLPSAGPNCGLTLHGWQARTEVLGMSFVPRDPEAGACVAQSRYLSLDQVVDVVALSRPLMLSGEWTPQGQLRNGRLRGSTENQLDSNAQHQGFDLALGSSLSMYRGVGAADEGWFHFDEVSVGVPFWQRLKPQLRIGNDSEDSALASVMAGPGNLPKDQGNLSLARDIADNIPEPLGNDEDAPGRFDPNLDAEYTWGATSWTLGLPVYYASGRDRADIGPQWLGRTFDNTDLVVLSLKGGVDYIRPEFTQISFGASADFSRLSELDFDISIDLTDRAGLARIDEYLNSNLGLDVALEPNLGPLMDALAPLHRFAGPGLETLLRKGLDVAVDQAIAKGLGGNDPFALIASGFARAQSVPDEVVSMLADPLEEVLDELEARLSAELTGVLDNVVGEMSTQFHLLNKARVDREKAVTANNQDAIDAADKEIDEASKQLESLAASLSAEILGPIEDLRGEIIDLQQLARDSVTELRDLAEQLGLDAASGVFGELRAVVDTLRGAQQGQSDNILSLIAAVQNCSFLDSVSSKGQYEGGRSPPIGVPGVTTPSFNFDEPNFDFDFSAPDAHSFTRSLAALVQTLQQTANALTLLGDLAQQLTTMAESVGALNDTVSSALNTTTDLATNLGDEIVNRLLAIKASQACQALGAPAYMQPVLDQAAGYITQIDRYATTIQSEFDNYEALLTGFADSILPTGQDIDNSVNADSVLGQVNALYAYVQAVELAVNEAITTQAAGLQAYGTAALDQQDSFLNLVNAYIAAEQAEAIGLVTQRGFSAIDLLRQQLRAPLQDLIDDAKGQMTAALRAALAELPSPSAQELRAEFVNLLLQSDYAEGMLNTVNEQLAELLDEMDGLNLNLEAQLNLALREVLEQALAEVQAVLNEATAGLTDIDAMAAGRLDGHAVIHGDELYRAHVEAEFNVGGADADTSWGFNAALDLESWSANGKAIGCADLVSNPGAILDASISTRDLPLNFGNSDIVAKKIALGFTLDGQGDVILPIGVNGLIDTRGGISFASFRIEDMAAAAGFGAIESYLGARAAAQIDAISAEAAFLAGRTCNFEVLQALDPQAAEFIGFGAEDRFEGAFARAKASVPIWSNGCALSVAVGADIGGWVIQQPPLRVGGIFGGSATGQLGCIASLRGEVTTFGELVEGNFSFRGDGFGVAGVGWDCDPGSWKTVERSRDDDWCATGDASFSATYRNGWMLGDTGVSAIH